jgi:hypothetical protein
MTRIDWARMARPQPDGYDTRMALSLIESESTPWRARGFRRPAPNGGPGIAGGTVALSAAEPLLPPPRWQAIDGVPPALEQAIDLVGRWPEAADQWPRIIHTIQCFTDAERPGARLYSASHSVGSRTGVIGLTPHCPLATAQALVHEMAHTKLRAMGVDNENAIRIVTNPPREMFFSPVVGEERPMTAVLHAQYSFIHVLQLDTLMLETEPDEQTRSHIHRLIARNVPRMDAGRDIVARFMRMDRDGEDFMAAFLGWTEEVLKRGHELLRSDAV